MVETLKWGEECSPSSEHPHPYGASLAPVLTEGQHSNLWVMIEVIVTIMVVVTVMVVK